MQAKI